MNVLKSPLKRYLSIALSTILTLTCITPMGAKAATSGNITVDGSAQRSVTVDKTSKTATAHYNVDLSLYGLDAMPSSTKKNVVIAVDWTSDSEQNIKNAINKVLIPRLRGSSGITHLNIGVVSMESGHARTRLTSTLRLYGLKGEGVDINRNLDNITRAVNDSRPNGQRNLGDGLRLAHSNVKATADFVEDPPNGYNPNDYDKYVVFVGGGSPNYYTSDRSSGYYYGTGEDGQGMSYYPSDAKGVAYFKDIADKINTSKLGSSTVAFTEGDKNIKTFIVKTGEVDDSYNYVAGKLSTSVKSAGGGDSSSINSIFTEIANSILYKEEGEALGSSITKASEIASNITLDEVMSSNLTLDLSSLNGIQSTNIEGGVALSKLPVKSVVYNSTTKAYEVKLDFSLNYKKASESSTGLFILGKDGLSKVNVSDITTLALPEYKFTFDDDLSDSVIREVDVDKTNKKVNATYTIKANVKADNQGEVTQGSGKKNIVIAVDWNTTSKANVIKAIQNTLIPTIEAKTNITNLNIGIVSMESGHARTRLTSGLKLYALKGGGRDYDRNYDNISRALEDSRPDDTRNLGDGLRLAYSNVKAPTSNVVSAPSGYNLNDYDKYVIFVGSGDAAYYTKGESGQPYYYGTVSDGSGLTCLQNTTSGKAYFRDIADKINASKSGNGDVEFTKGDKNIKSFVVGTSLSSNTEYNYVAGKIGATLKESSGSDSTAINNIFKGIADEIIKGSVVTPPDAGNITTTLSSKINLEEQLSSNLKLDLASLSGITSTSITGGVKLSGLPIQSAVYNSTKGGYDIVSKFTVAYNAENVTSTAKYILGNNFASKVNISTDKILKLPKYEFTFDDVKRYNISNDGNEIRIKYKVNPGKESVGNDSIEIKRIQGLESLYGYPQGRVVFEEYMKSNLKVKEVIPITEGLKFNIDNLGGKVSLDPVLTEYKIQSSGDYAICKKGTTQNLSELEFDVVYTLNGYYPFSVGSKSVSGGNIFNSYA
ncbi:MAG: hypothetical protein RSB66_05960, partial [Clostridium sp.]